MIRETEVDRQREREVAEFVAFAAGATLVEMPPLSCCDFIAVRGGKGVALIEVKCRSHGLTDYPTLMLGKHKADNLVRVGYLLKARPILAVSFNGGIATLTLTESLLEDPVMGGRTDRGDSTDMEPCYHFPVELFRPVNSIKDGR